MRKEILALRAELAASQVEKNKLQDELALLRAKNIDAMSLLAQKEDKSPIKEISLQ